MRARHSLSGWQVAGVVAGVFLSLATLAFLAIGAVFLYAGISFARECRAAEKAVPLRLAVDLSQRGITRGTMLQTASFSCKQSYSLEPANAGAAVPQFDGLKLVFTVLDHGGDELVVGTYPSSLGRYTDLPGAPLSFKSPIPEGQYAVSVEVLEPAANSTVPVVVSSRYSICGVEWMGVWWFLGIGVTGLLLAVPTGAVALVVTTTTFGSALPIRRKRRHAAAST